MPTFGFGCSLLRFIPCGLMRASRGVPSIHYFFIVIPPDCKLECGLMQTGEDHFLERNIRRFLQCELGARSFSLHLRALNMAGFCSCFCTLLGSKIAKLVYISNSSASCQLYTTMLKWGYKPTHSWGAALRMCLKVLKHIETHFDWVTGAYLVEYFGSCRLWNWFQSGRRWSPFSEQWQVAKIPHFSMQDLNVAWAFAHRFHRYESMADLRKCTNTWLWVKISERSPDANWSSSCSNHEVFCQCGEEQLDPTPSSFLAVICCDEPSAWRAGVRTFRRRRRSQLFRSHHSSKRILGSW